jgi:hypothetical protein
MAKISDINFCICSISNRPELSQKTYPTLVHYAQKWGYTIHIESHTLDETRHIAWSKVLLLQRLLPQYDICVWVDDDILITDSQKPLEYFITENFRHGKTGFMISADTLPQTPMNTGIVFVRNIPAGTYMLQKVWNQCDMLGKRQEACWEQDAFNATWLYMDKSWVDIIPYRTLQTHIRDWNLPLELFWQPGDFAAHVTGMGLERRLQIMDDLLANPLAFDPAKYLIKAL